MNRKDKILDLMRMVAGIGHETEGQKEEFDERISGRGSFVNEILKEAEDRQLCRFRHKSAGRTSGNLIGEECRRRGVNLQELKRGSKRRKVSKARAVIVRRSREELGLTAADIARHLGVNTSSIVRAIEHIA